MFDSKKFDSKKHIRRGNCGYDGSSRALVPCCIVCATLLSSSAPFCRAADVKLAIVGGGVQQAEDAPFVSSSFRFLPGDYLYFTFGIAGFGIQSQDRGEVRKISLRYEVKPEDARGIPLAPAVGGSIEAELSPEDKNWTPKRRTSFLLPPFVAAGDFHVHVTVRDLVAKSETAKDFPFRIGGVEVSVAQAITLTSFRFLRKESDQEALEVPAYSPGDTVYARFYMLGFATDPQNTYHVSYDVMVLGPDGKPFVQRPQAAEISDRSFYPAQYLPGDLTVTTSSTSKRGEYVVIVTLHDLIGHTTYEAKRAFSIE